MRRTDATGLTDDLTRREAQVATHLYDGLTYRQIASRLCIAVGTVKNHMNSIYRKKGTHNRTSLIHLFSENRERSLSRTSAAAAIISPGNGLTAYGGQAMSYTPCDYDIVTISDQPDKMFELCGEPRYNDAGRLEIGALLYGWKPNNPKSFDEFAPEIIINDLGTVTLVRRPGAPQVCGNRAL